MNKKFTRSVAVTAGIAGAAVMGLTSLGAGGAAAGPLPGANVTKTLVDGTKVNINLFNESVDVHPAVTNIATSREVFVSGKVRVTVGGKAKGASVKAGYIVGCQLDFGAGAEAGTGNVLSPGLNSGDEDTDSSSAGGGFTLAPGQAVYTPVIQTTDSDDDGVTDYTFKGNSGGVAYSQERFGVDGCAGYAQAKAKIEVTVDTDAVKGVVVAFGKPFSIG